LGAIVFQAINLYPCEAGFITEPRIFDYHYLLYVHEGFGTYTIGGVAHSAGAGDLFYCPPGVSNTICAADENPYVLSGVEFRNGSLDAIEDIRACTNLLARPFWIGAIRQMIDGFELGRSHLEKCAHLLSALLEELRLGDEQNHALCILEYLRSNIDRNVTHRELSQRFFYHKNAINALLLRNTGKTLKAYQIELRIKRAASLLLYSDKSVAQISELCGYANASFFSRQFQKYMGLTPLAYRKGKRHDKRS